METCGFDARTYPDPYGQKVLASYGAIVLIPRKPLAAGHEYHVSVTSHRSAYSWTFGIEQTTPAVSRSPQEYDHGTRRAR